MIRYQMPFLNPAFPSFCQIVKNVSEPFFHRREDRFLSIFRHKNNVIFAIPCRVVKMISLYYR